MIDVATQAHTRIALMLTAVLQGSPVVLECVVPGESGERTYALLDKGAEREPRWWLTLQSATDGGNAVIELPLANAVIRGRAPQLRLSSKSANGGLSVELDSNADRSTLDVFVNFELEVNVWRDLSPDVERMNTNGATAARCRSLSHGDGLP